MMRIIRNITPGRWSLYLVLGPLFNKSLEVGYQWSQRYHFDMRFQLNFRGHDHAGLKFHVDFGRLLLEFNITDGRHWDYKNDRWHDGTSEDDEACT